MRDSEVFAVKSTPSNIIPEFGQSPEHDAEISALVRAEETVHVFEHKNSGATFSKQSSKLMKEPRLATSKPLTLAHACKRDVLAREAGDPDICGRELCTFHLTNIGRTLFIGNQGPMLSKNLAAESVSLALEYGLEPGPVETQIESADAREERHHAVGGIRILGFRGPGRESTDAANVLLGKYTPAVPVPRDVSDALREEPSLQGDGRHPELGRGFGKRKGGGHGQSRGGRAGAG